MLDTAIVLAAGYGTRFLPITRVVPKELLPIVARPALDLVVEELVGAGVRRLLVVTSRRKRSLEDWFDRDPELEAVFSAEGAAAKLAAIAPRDLEVQFVRQPRMTGTGDALRLARRYVGDRPALVAFPDDLFGAPNASAQLVAAWRATGASVLGALDLSGRDVSAYGVLDVEPGEAPWRVRRVVEKPAPGTEPSHLVSAGRFLYTPAMFDALEACHGDHAGGEYIPMPAMERLAARGELVATVLDAPRWDTGTPQGYLEAVIDHALADPRLAGPLRAFLHERLNG